jgi:hypothetical protein
MIKNKLPQYHQIAYALSLVMIGLVTSPKVQATPAPSFHNRITPTPNLLAQKFPDNGEPTGRRHGGTSRRDECPDLTTPLTALVPGEEKTNTSFLALTVAEYPTFWVYVPQLPSNLRSGEFVLQDDRGNDIYRTSLILPEKPGIISVNLPSNSEYALKQNLKYHWFFRVYCGDPQNKPEYFFVDAWLQRVAMTPKLKQQLKATNTSEYQVYRDNNLWYDALTNLAELRRTHSNVNAESEDWTNLFNAAGLEKLVSAPIVQHYNNPQN